MPLELTCMVNKGCHVKVLASPERVKCGALLLRGCNIAVAYVQIAGCAHTYRGITCRPPARLLALLCASCTDTDILGIDPKGCRIIAWHDVVNTAALIISIHMSMHMNVSKWCWESVAG